MAQNLKARRTPINSNQKGEFSDMRIVTTVLVSLTLLFSLAATADAEQESLEAAEQWLELVDDGAYAESWDKSADLFQSNVKKEDWVLALERVHTPLGKIRSRVYQNSELKSSLPGVPDGEYVVIAFTTSFERKTNATETVTVMRTDDGNWKAAGYFIQ